ncbi:1,4-dihydroxy-2-naphthoyl-CoA synthase [Bradyrhizobium sp. i1.8.4]|uniref:hypothetical protein n=1 Tax=unclassified Bradyrhizobium TaxID=2631580 RepID=UPI003D1B5940
MADMTTKYEIVEQILTISLHRPEKLNALPPTGERELIDAFDRTDKDDLRQHDEGRASFLERGHVRSRQAARAYEAPSKRSADRDSASVPFSVPPPSGNRIRVSVLGKQRRVGVSTGGHRVPDVPEQ